MDPVNFWLVFLLGAMSLSPFMFMLGAAITRRKIENELAEAAFYAQRMEHGWAEER